MLQHGSTTSSSNARVARAAARTSTLECHRQAVLPRTFACGQAASSQTTTFTSNSISISPPTMWQAATGL
jgi:hypothetical protein